MAKRVPIWAKPKQRRIVYGAGGAGVRSSLAFPTLAGPPINEQISLSISAVWSAVMKISNAIACLDSGVAERLPNGGRRLATELPIYNRIARSPNDRMTAFKFRQSLMLHALTSGNGYAEIEWKGREVAALHLLEPSNIEPYVDQEDNSLRYRMLHEQASVPASRILHIAGLAWDGIRGYSPISMGRDMLGLSKAQEQHQSGLMANNSTPNGFIKFPGSLTELQLQRKRSDFELMHKGSENAGTLGFLWAGAEWVQTSFSPADAELLLSRAFSIDEIARLFNIPAYFLNQANKSGFDLEDIQQEFCTFTILPWLAVIEQEMDRKLLCRTPRPALFVFHDMNTLSRADVATQTARDVADFEHGFASENEIRSRRGVNPINHPNANKHYIPTNNLQAIEDIPEPKGAIHADEDIPDLIIPSGSQEALPPQQDTVVSEAVRSAIVDPVSRMVRVFTSAATRQASKDRLDLWLEKWVGKHTTTTREAITPAFALASVVLGKPLDPATFAESLVTRQRDKLTDLVKMIEPSELPAAVERACEAFELEIGDMVKSILEPK